VEYFKYLCSMTTHDSRCTSEIKSSIAMTNMALKEKKAPFTSKFDLNLKKTSKMLHLGHSFIWCRKLRLQKVDHKYL